MPNIDHLQLYLRQVGLLFFPPLIPVVFHQLAALNPDSSIPLEILVGPILVNPGIHTALHGEHVSNCLFQSFSSLGDGVAMKLKHISRLRKKPSHRQLGYPS